MPCDVWLYDDALAAITAGTFEIMETDHWGVKIDLKTAYPVSASGGLGATLMSPTPPEPVKIFVDDLSGCYSPAIVGELHGGLPARLDISLYPLPPIVSASVAAAGPASGTRTYTPGQQPGSAPQTPDAVSSFIIEQVRGHGWTELEAAGAQTLYETVTRLATCWRLDGHLRQRALTWIEWLHLLGIQVESATKKTKRLAYGAAEG